MSIPKHACLPMASGSLMLAFCGAALLTDCSSQCAEGRIECHGNELWQCLRVSSDDLSTVWDKIDCGAHRYCRVGLVPGGTRQGAKEGVCAAEPDPEPSCLAATIDRRNNMSTCTPDGRAVACVVGYVEEVLATCASPALCIATATPAACSASNVPDPRCPTGQTHTTICQGDHAVTCADGYLLSDQDCGPGLCYTPSGPPPTCVTSATPDARCTAIAMGALTGVTYGCTGNSLFTCVDNLYTQAKDCGMDYCQALGAGSSFCGRTPP